jgi:hypothetical protein
MANMRWNNSINSQERDNYLELVFAVKIRDVYRSQPRKESI